MSSNETKTDGKLENAITHARLEYDKHFKAGYLSYPDKRVDYPVMEMSKGYYASESAWISGWNAAKEDESKGNRIVEPDGVDSWSANYRDAIESLKG